MEYVHQFKVAPGATVKLAEIDPAQTDGHENHKAALEEIAHYQTRLRELQELLYTEGRHALLICLQAMDTGGKDGTISHVLGAMNPQGCRVARSHYEDVLVVRVHNFVPEDVWSRRYKQINAFETGLVEHDTHILKFYLHISKEEQLKRFKERLDDPAKQWKISEADYQERSFWDDYVSAYEAALSRSSTEHAPWFVIPADHKWFRNLAVARIVVEYLETLNMKYPEPKVDLAHIRREYHAAMKA